MWLNNNTAKWVKIITTGYNKPYELSHHNF